MGSGSLGAGVSVATFPSSIGAGDALDGPSDAGDLAVDSSCVGVVPGHGDLDILLVILYMRVKVPSVRSILYSTTR